MKLLINALTKFIFGLVFIGAFLFIPAKTFHYRGAWLFIGILFIPMLIIGGIMLLKNPALLEKRLDAKEKQSAQRGVIALSALMFPAGFILSALDFRFAWSHVPPWLTLAAAVLFLLGYAMYAEVMRENAYLSRTIQVQEGQTVVDTGLYSIVRHPMYSATLLMFLPLPLILGSLWGLIPFLFYPVIIVVRILNEEKLLTENLNGYTQYKKTVTYRLIPLIW